MTWLRLALCSLLWLPAYTVLAVLWLIGHPACLVLGLRDRPGRRRRTIEYRLAPLGAGERTWQWAPRWAWLWSNPEDHVDGPRVTPPSSPSTRRWWERAQAWPFWRRAWSWSAWRNTVANERMLWEPIAQHGQAAGPAVPLWSSRDVRWVGNCGHVHEVWKYLVYDEHLALGGQPSWGWRPRFLWHFARKGLRSGLWVRRMIDTQDPGAGYDEVRIGWKIIPAPARDAERYAGLGLQLHRHRRGADPA